MLNKFIFRSIFFFCLFGSYSQLSYGQQKPQAALFGIDSTKTSTLIENNTAKPEAKPFDIPANNGNSNSGNNAANKNATKPEPSLTGGPK